MDTISRENNSMLPVAGVIVGVIGLLLGGYAAITISKVNKTLAEHEAKVARIDAIEGAANSAAQSAAQAAKDVKSLERSTQNAFNDVGPILGNLQAAVTRLEDATKKAPAPAAGGKKGGDAPVAGPGEYVVKAGDTGMKIAQANQIDVRDLQAVNPGVNWSKLRPGDKIKLPARK